ncbi:MAG: hypothetical protein ABSG59_01215 [Verrucomicrobiota bacterium]|jgi:hypothetical protein
MRRTLSIFGTVSAVVVVSAFSYQAHVQKEKLNNFVFSEKAAEVLGNMVILQQLRQNQQSNALELLEMNIDSGMIILEKAPHRLSPTVLENINESIRLLKQYRQTYPRKKESIIDNDH